MIEKLVKDYLTALKNKGNFSWSEISKMSGLPDATIRKIFSGETADPRLETVIRLVTAMGGSLDEMVEVKKKEESIEMNSIMTMKSIYEGRIDDIKEHMDSLKKDKRHLMIAVCVLAAVLLTFVTVDVFVGSIGWIRF